MFQNDHEVNEQSSPALSEGEPVNHAYFVFSDRIAQGESMLVDTEQRAWNDFGRFRMGYTYGQAEW